MTPAGVLIAVDGIADPWPGCRELAAAVEDAMRRGGLSIVGRSDHHFTPHGLTVTWVLAESHGALHTYPESRMFSFDVYTCGGVDPRPAASLVAGLATTSTMRAMARGALE